MKPGLELNTVVLLGRTFEEYTRYFGLDADQLGGKRILDIASGVSSFCAESHRCGFDVTACDPIYELAPEAIRQRSEPDLAFVTAEIGKVRAYKWDFYKSPEGMRAYRERAFRLFLPDYTAARGKRYIAGRLPRLPFPDGHFDLTLVSYFLFVYEEQFDLEFHRQALREVLRVTKGEARLYPLVNFRAERCAHVAPLKAELSEWRFEEIKTDFEFLANSNAYLKITRA